MEDAYDKIWEKAFPYQDKRGDSGHASVTLEYAKTLLAPEKGDEKVIVPAIILHDIGWSRVAADKAMVIFDQKASPEEKREARLEHQNKGVELARKILNSVQYPENLTKEILEIISQHDTRQGFISKNEGLVRDADKLWRFSGIGFDLDIKRFKFTSQQNYERTDKRIAEPGFFFSDSAKQIARNELEKRKQEYSLNN
jgi:HD superfamily phosphodiesterase